MGDFLMHYGIKGMRWGVRRTPEELGHNKTTEEKYNEAVRIAKEFIDLFCKEHKGL